MDVIKYTTWVVMHLLVAVGQMEFECHNEICVCENVFKKKVNRKIKVGHNNLPNIMHDTYLLNFMPSAQMI